MYEIDKYQIALLIDRARGIQIDMQGQDAIEYNCKQLGFSSDHPVTEGAKEYYRRIAQSMVSMSLFREVTKCYSSGGSYETLHINTCFCIAVAV